MRDSKASTRIGYCWNRLMMPKTLAMFHCTSALFWGSWNVSHFKPSVVWQWALWQRTSPDSPKGKDVIGADLCVAMEWEGFYTFDYPELSRASATRQSRRVLQWQSWRRHPGVIPKYKRSSFQKRPSCNGVFSYQLKNQIPQETWLGSVTSQSLRLHHQLRNSCFFPVEAWSVHTVARAAAALSFAKASGFPMKKWKLCCV